MSKPKGEYKKEFLARQAALGRKRRDICTTDEEFEAIKSLLWNMRRKQNEKENDEKLK